jgi:hypothetical protein
LSTRRIGNVQARESERESERGKREKAKIAMEGREKAV